MLKSRALSIAVNEFYGEDNDKIISILTDVSFSLVCIISINQCCIIILGSHSRVYKNSHTVSANLPAGITNTTSYFGI